MLKKKKRGQPAATGVNLGKHWKTIDSFCFPPSPKTIEPFEKALPFPENHWSVRKTSPRPLPLLPGRGQRRDPFIQCPLPSSLVGTVELHIIPLAYFSMDMEDERIFVCQPFLNSPSFTLDDFCLLWKLLCLFDFKKCLFDPYPYT